MKAKRKRQYHFSITEEGRWLGLPLNIWEDLTSSFKGSPVTMTIGPGVKQKTIPQLGYFYGVVFPHWMYALINSGHDLELGNAIHEKIVEDDLKKRYLDNGTEWISALDSEVYSPVDGFVQYTRNTECEVNSLIAKINDGTKRHQVLSPAAGFLQKNFSDGDEVKMNDVLMIVHHQHKIKAAASLANSNTKEVNKMIDLIRRDCWAWFQHEIPDPDPLREQNAKTVKAELMQLIHLKNQDGNSIN